jgi:hypothetical protein
LDFANFLVAENLDTDNLIADNLDTDNLNTDNLIAEKLDTDNLIADNLIADNLIADNLIADLISVYAKVYYPSQFHHLDSRSNQIQVNFYDTKFFYYHYYAILFFEINSQKYCNMIDLLSLLIHIYHFLF